MTEAQIPLKFLTFPEAMLPLEGWGSSGSLRLESVLHWTLTGLYRQAHLAQGQLVQPSGGGEAGKSCCHHGMVGSSLKQYRACGFLVPTDGKKIVETPF